MATKKKDLQRLVQASQKVVDHFSPILDSRHLDPEEHAILIALEAAVAPFIKEFRMIQEG